jgi:hypothetical protein
MSSMHIAWTTLAGVGAMLAAALLGGCSSGLDKDQCQTADWNTIGFEDGLNGLPAERIGVHRVACAKHQVAPNLAAYTAGRERGIQDYCEPRNGFRVGLYGRTYANVCPETSEAPFVDAYRMGRQIYAARAELRNTQSRLQAAKNGLAQAEVAVVNITAELVQPQVPTPRRLFLAQELVRLAGERTGLEAQIGRLTLRTHELAVDVGELERRSPFTL